MRQVALCTKLFVRGPLRNHLKLAPYLCSNTKPTLFNKPTNIESSFIMYFDCYFVKRKFQSSCLTFNFFLYFRSNCSTPGSWLTWQMENSLDNSEPTIVKTWKHALKIPYLRILLVHCNFIFWSFKLFMTDILAHLILTIYWQKYFDLFFALQRLQTVEI